MRRPGDSRLKSSDRNLQCRTVARTSSGSAHIVMVLFSTLSFAALLYRGGVESANRSDRLGRSLVFAPPRGTDTACSAGRL